jgi:hypothetical protein
MWMVRQELYKSPAVQIENAPTKSSEHLEPFATVPIKRSGQKTPNDKSCDHISEGCLEASCKFTI